MSQVRIIIEYTKDAAAPDMRWERQVAVVKGSTFELLGRAFEVAQREEGESFAQALTSFFRGALMRKEDVADVLAQLE